MKKTLRHSATKFILILVAIYSCKTYYFRSNYRDVNSLLHETKNIKEKLFLKAHLKNGNVCILKDTWQVDTLSNVITGKGIMYNFNRENIHEGDIAISIDSVSVFETNKKIVKPESGRIAALSILTGIDVIFGLVCITNPKACFGSCPTFYINANDNFHYADAEGFSNAISPSMEYSDIDALNNTFIPGNNFSLTMKNEALETHCVNEVKLLAFPRKNDERVYHSPTNEFYLCNEIYPLAQAEGNEGDITSLLKHEDRIERYSASDENNLSSKEEIVLTFNNTGQNKENGLLLNFRQTLMTTYFIYNAIGYMGDEVSDIFAKIESNKEIKNKLKGGIKKELGEIDIYCWNEKTKEWEFKNGFYETGPIAFNKQFIPLTHSNGKTVKVKIVMNKGLWRIDYAALTGISQKVVPVELYPVSIYNKGEKDQQALAEIIDPKKHLISMPGSEYSFNFNLPESAKDYELFVCSKGYYIEWMREHWINDKNLFKLKDMVDHPKKYLKDEAKNYKKYEAEMEKEFWNSKIDTKTFSYYEK